MSPRPPISARPWRGRAAVLLVGALLAGGCTIGADEQGSDSGPSPSPGTRDAKLDLSGVPVPRAEFCARLDEDGVTQALGGPVLDTVHYGNGDEFEVRPGRVDISHEFGCTFEGRPGHVARAWVFARPVTRAEARTLVRRARRGPECAFPQPLVFGSPGLTSVCELAGPPPEEAPEVRTRLQGLFGDSWLGCEVSEPVRRGDAEPRADVVQRAVQWCTEVVTAVGAQG